jgi:RNA polymerase sigma-70 factor (ECF subfamily)
MARAPHLSIVAPGAAEPAPPPTLEAAFRAYARYVGAVAYRILGRDEEVDDVVQDVFLAGWKGLGALRDGDLAKQWLRTVTVRIASRRLRRRRLRGFLGLDERGYEDVAAGGASPEQRALLGSVYRALDGLPVAERVAWTLRHVEGLDLATVAESCGCSLATAKRRIAGARARLDEVLGDG